MSEATESNLNEMMAGDGSGLSMPPAFVFVNTKKKRTYKGKDSVDGRTKGAKQMLSRISKRKKMKEELETQIVEAAPSETERAQQQIAQQKKLTRQQTLQKKRKEAKEKMMGKTQEMEKLMKARLTDLRNKTKNQEKKVKKDSYEMKGDTMIFESSDALEVALQVATSELNPQGETSFAKIDFSDGTSQNLDNFSAKRIAACYAQLDPEKQQQYRFMLNKDASTFQSALDFAIRNV
jgi:molecular chaperone GrpE (heat shock protein)